MFWRNALTLGLNGDGGERRLLRYAARATHLRACSLAPLTYVCPAATILLLRNARHRGTFCGRHACPLWRASAA